MQEKKHFSTNIRVFIGGVELTGVTPIKYGPKYIQVVTFILKVPYKKRMCSPIMETELNLN